jgi:DNA-binding response OmpR family regulator
VKTKIIIIEDDVVTAMNLKMSLEKLNYEVIAIADNYIQARSKIKIYEPDVALIDISLEEEKEGIEIATYIQTHNPMPFIYLTSHSGKDILDSAKKTEPYGYIVKPFEPKSLNATIEMAQYKFAEEQKLKSTYEEMKEDKSNLEKLLFSKTTQDANVPFAQGYHLNVSNCEVFYNDSILKLTKKENSFVRLLVAQMGSVVSFEQVISYVWEDNSATNNSVRTLVWRLRNKLPTDIIKNASGMGYTIENYTAS